MCASTGYETVKVTQLLGASAWVVAFFVILISTGTTRGQTKTWTTTAEFDGGFPINSDGVDDAPGDGELAIRTDPETLPYIWVACSQRGTVVRIATSTFFDPRTQLPVTKGQVLGEYLTSPTLSPTWDCGRKPGGPGVPVCPWAPPEADRSRPRL